MIPNIWVEKTDVKKRVDRQSGPYAFGVALWSPQKDKRGADIYSNLRKVKEGDIILHITDRAGFTAVSKAKSNFYEENIIAGTEWDGPGYLIPLKEFTSIPLIDRKLILNSKNKVLLDRLRGEFNVFYNSELNLNQGGYFTECPLELANLINNLYFLENKKNLPFLENISSSNNTIAGMNFKIQSLISSLLLSGIKVSKNLTERYIISLLTKPFVILTGLSGSGKTKLAQAFSQWICEDESQVCIVPVGADWTNREPLLGFPNALEPDKYVKPDNRALDLLLEAGKSENHSKPYFLILDEMNLSHVERYFADFLSVMESKGKFSLHAGPKERDGVPSEISLPRNLFIIGTVNIDETTYMFSPKVLDRASVLEFRVTSDEMKDFLDGNTIVDLGNLKGKGASMASSFVEISANKQLAPKDNDGLQSELLKFFNELKKAGAEFGYRSASEIYRFAAVVNHLEPAWTTNEIIDSAIMQKLLPKVHGARRKLEPILKTLGKLCLVDGIEIDSYLVPNTEFNFKEGTKVRYPISLEKIIRMYQNLMQNGFTSYAEA